MNKVSSTKKSTRLYKVGEAARLLGVSIETLRRWEAAGKLTPVRTEGGTRYYSKETLSQINPNLTLNKTFPTPASTGKVLGRVDLPRYSAPILNVPSETENIEINQPVNSTQIDQNDSEYGKKSSRSLRIVAGTVLAVLILSLVGIGASMAFPISSLNVKNNTINLSQSVSTNPTLKDVLAEASASAHLEINSDTTINGNLTAPNIVYSVNAGANITVTGDPQRPTISATALTETDTLATVTARGAVTSTALTLNGGVTFGSTLKLGNLSSDPASGSNGQIYYNTTSNIFRCYVNGTWVDCDTNTGGSNAGDITGVSVGNGLSGGGSSGDVTIDLLLPTSGTSANSSSNSGLETTASGLSLLRGCSDSQVLKWIAATSTWDCGIGGGGGSLITQEGGVDVNTNTTTLNFTGGDFDLSPSGNTTTVTMAAVPTSLTGSSGNFNVGGASLTTSQTTANLFNTTATTLNIGGAATVMNVGPPGASGTIAFSGGSLDTGCTLNGTTGDLTCSGSITGGSSGTVGYWQRAGTTLSPATPGDSISFTGTLNTNTFTSTALTFAGSDPVISASTAATSISLNPGAGGLLNLAGGSGSTGCTVNDTDGSLTCTGSISGGGTGTEGFWDRSGITLTPHNTGDNVSTSGNISATGTGAVTSGGTLTAQNGLTLSTGALALTSTSGTAALTLTSSTTAWNVQSGLFDIDTSASRVGIGTAAPNSKLDVLSTTSPQLRVSYDTSNYATLGVSSAGALTIDTNLTGNIGIGTGANAKTITIGNNTGATALNFTSGTGTQTFTSSVATGTAYVFTDAALTTGTGISLTTNALTTGTAFQLTATALTSGSFFDINNGSSIFNVSNTSFTSSLPVNFTSPGDISIAYDINFTNPTASYIKSAAPLYIVAGKVFNSSDLTLRTYNQGTLVVDSGQTTGTLMDLTNSTLTTGIGVDGTFSALTTGTGMQIVANALSTGKGLNITSTSTAGNGSTLLNLSRSGANGTSSVSNYGIQSNITNTGTSSTNYAGYFLASGGTTNYPLAFGYDSTHLSKISVSSAGLETHSITDGQSLVYTDGTNTLCTITDAGTTGNLSCTGTITGAAAGTVGYWTRASTTLSPATGNDVVSVTSNDNTNATLNIANNTANTIGGGGNTLGVVAINSSSITTGNLVNIASTGTGLTSGSLLNVTSATTGAVATNGIVALKATGAYTSTANAGLLTLTANSTLTGTVESIFANALTTGTALNISSTSTALAGTAVTGQGLLQNLDWSPGSATTASGDLFRLHIGANGLVSGNAFDIVNDTSSIFSVNPQAFTTSLPSNFTSSGDVAIAYDLNFTNSTSSFIKSAAPLNIQSGTVYNSSDLNLQTYNVGSINLVQANTTTTTSATSYAVEVLPNLTSSTNSLAHTWYSFYNNPTVNESGSGVAVTTLYGNYQGLTATAGTITTYFGNYIAAPTGSGTVTNKYALVTEATAGNVGVGTTAPVGLLDITGTSNTGATLSLTNNTATTIGNGANTLGVLDLQSTTLNTGNFLNIELNALTTGAGINLSHTTSVIASGGSLARISSTSVDTGTTKGVLLDLSSTASTAGTQVLGTFSGLTTGIGQSIVTNALSSGQALSVTSSSTATTGTSTTGSLLNVSETGAMTSSFVGNLAYIDWTPGSTPATFPTGDLLRINLGANATGYTGNLFNLVDSGSSIFSVSKTAVTTSLPANFTSSGDVSVAYDLNFTNPTSSFIKSAAPLYVQAGETFNSSNLTLKTYNEGSTVVDSGNITGTAFDLTNSTLTTGVGVNIALSGSAQTTASALAITQSGTTTGYTGNFVNITGSSTTGTGNLVALTSVNTTNGSALKITSNSLTTGNGLTVTSSGTITTGGTVAQFTGSGLTTGIGVGVTTNAITSGNAVNVSSSATAFTGALGLFSLTGSNSANTGSVLEVDNTGTASTNAAFYIKHYATGTGNLALRVDDVSGDTSPFVIDGAGNVGIGTSSPDNNLMIDNAGDQGGIHVKGTNAGDIRLRLEQNSVSGYVFLQQSDSNKLVVQSAGDLKFFTNGANSSATIGANGNVTLGINSTSGTLTADIGGTQTSHVVCHSGASADTDNVGIVDCDAGPYDDYAEMYPVVSGAEEGDLVATGSEMVTIYDQDQNDNIDWTKAKGQVTRLVKSSSPYQQNLIGIVSKNYGDLSSTGYNIKKTDNPKSIALNGRVPVKVSLENGPIHAGDYLTSSSIPGVAAKAVKPGQVVGKALEDFPGMQGQAFTPNTIGRIIVFVNVTYADPNNALANLLIGKDGTLAPPTLSANKLLIPATTTPSAHELNGALVYEVQTGGANSSYALDVAASLRSVDSKLSMLAENQASNSAQIADVAGRADVLAAQVASNSASLNNAVTSTSSRISDLQKKIDELLNGFGNKNESSNSASASAQLADNSLNLTPPQALISNNNPVLESLKVNSEATFSGKLNAYQAVVSDSFKSLGKTSLGDTTVAGNLSIDGTLALTGNSINSAYSPGGISGILYIQNSPLASLVDFFNGLVTIDNKGLVKAKTIETEQIKLTGGRSAGEAIIPAGELEIPVFNGLVEDNSLVIITPETNTAQVIAVPTKVEGSGFVASIATPSLKDIKFSYLIIGQGKKEASN